MTADLNRIIIQLKDEEGLTYGEIAEKFGLTWDAVRNRYRRNRHKDFDDPSPEGGGCVVIGVTPDDTLIDVQEIWQRHIRAQEAVEQYLRVKREEQRIILKPPCAQAILSDLHLDDPQTDYRSIYADAQLIQETPDFYAGFLGDGLNN